MYKLKSKYCIGVGYKITLYKGFRPLRSWYSDVEVVGNTTTDREYNIRVNSYVERYKKETEGLVELNKAEAIDTYKDRLSYIQSGKLNDCMKEPYWLREVMIEYLKSERGWGKFVEYKHTGNYFGNGKKSESYEIVLENMVRGKK